MTDRMPTFERKILAAIQHGLGDSITPFRDLAAGVGAEVGNVLAVLRAWKKDGRLRRIGAIVSHFKAGLPAGAMVVWRVKAEHVERAGALFADFEQVSHVYERGATADWPYSLYTMVHGRSDKDVGLVVGRMSRISGISDYRVLSTIEELKKVPPKYPGNAE
ncbi:MAG: hypothetical protein JSW59_09480 [Phycisphaerales bacterium]|nr:MAG: hypothetical protein JSW59_09480 [Phycisphaerales bacterium]